jgi:hypothetical protein
VQLGSHVTRGQELAQLDTTLIDEQIAEAEATLATAQEPNNSVRLPLLVFTIHTVLSSRSVAMIVPPLRIILPRLLNWLFNVEVPPEGVHCFKSFSEA